MAYKHTCTLTQIISKLSTLCDENVLFINENVSTAIFIERLCHIFIVDETWDLSAPVYKAAPVPTFFILIVKIQSFKHYTTLYFMTSSHLSRNKSCLTYFRSHFKSYKIIILPL